MLLIVGAIFCCGLILFSFSTPSEAKRRKFKQKTCIECHDEFVEAYFSKKNFHDGVKNEKCNDCHLNHGIVGKTIMKEEGNKLCYICHTLEDLKLDTEGMHTALKKGACTSCHDPHASDSDFLLSTEGNAICFECHEEEDYNKEVVHAVIVEDGCAECHLAHGSAEQNLLTQSPIELCISCHDSGDSSFEDAHAGYPVEEKSCSVCHNPHSSNQPK